MTGTTGEGGDAARARQEAADWFSRVRAGPSAAELAAFEAWRAADRLNGESYDRLSRQWEQSIFLANTRLGKDRDLDRARAWHRHPSLRYAAAAALLVLVFGATLLLRPGTRPAPALTFASKSDAVRTVTLEDGSRVILDRNSTLQVSYTSSGRHLDLVRGRARFDVAHDPARPFVVNADGGSVLAHGTVFDVELRPTLVRVVLLRGSVEVRGDRGGTGAAQGRTLVPGQAVVFQHGKTPSAPVTADPVEANWPNAMLSFDGTPLREAVAGFNRRNATKLMLGSDRIGELRVTGAFAADDPVGFGQAAAAMFRLDLRRQPDATISLQ